MKLFNSVFYYDLREIKLLTNDLLILHALKILINDNFPYLLFQKSVV